MDDNFADFLRLVREMRDAQRLYFRGRSAEALIRSKELERAVDGEIKRISEGPQLFD